MTPRKALDSGASHLVVARPIIQAIDPLAATKKILAEMSDNCS
ncbi:orotidine-5'-phosphate decarboxylase [Bartonella sp. WD12.1]|nr:orotidine-5'-phosphate decarboxylase [Bartonella sp. WD12.1]